MLRQMTIMCNDVENLIRVYRDKCINYNYFVDVTDEQNIVEIAKSELLIMEIVNSIVLSVDEFCSNEDIVGKLKAQKINAIVLENTITTYDKKYIGFKTLDELVDFVINENKKFKFIKKTATYLSNHQSEKIVELFEVSDDIEILEQDTKDLFVF